MPNLIFTGDLLPADRQHTRGIGLGSAINKHKEERWLSSFNVKKNEDSILFGNLEAPLVSALIQDEFRKEEFAGQVYFAEWLNSAGYDMVSVANNHILEFGEAGFHQTLKLLEKADVQAVGIADNQTGSNLVTVNKSGLNIGFAAFNAVHDILIQNIYAELNSINIEKAISALKRMGVDLVCLSFHWGNEYIHIPSFSQIELAHQAIEFGADVIIGHHPHVVQPVEMYRDGMIIYSLGNCIFDMNWSKNVSTGMSVELKINKKGIERFKTLSVEIDNKFIPTIKPDDAWLHDLLERNHKKMISLYKKGKTEYDLVYNKELAKNRFFARLGMKKQLLLQWFTLPANVRRDILRRWFLKK